MSILAPRARFQQRSRRIIPLDCPVLSRFESVILFVRFCISLWMRCIRPGKSIFEPCRVGPVRAGRPRRIRRWVLLATISGRVVVRRSVELIVDSHDKQAALHESCQDENSPRAPASPPKSHEKAGGEDEPARGLDAHHRDAQATNVFEVVRCPDLRNVLNRRKDGRHDA